MNISIIDKKIQKKYKMDNAKSINFNLIDSNFCYCIVENDNHLIYLFFSRIIFRWELVKNLTLIINKKQLDQKRLNSYVDNICEYRKTIKNLKNKRDNDA